VEPISKQGDHAEHLCRRPNSRRSTIYVALPGNNSHALIVDREHHASLVSKASTLLPACSLLPYLSFLRRATGETLYRAQATLVRCAKGSIQHLLLDGPPHSLRKSADNLCVLSTEPQRDHYGFFQAWGQEVDWLTKQTTMSADVVHSTNCSDRLIIVQYFERNTIVFSQGIDHALVVPTAPYCSPATILSGLGLGFTVKHKEKR